MQPQYRSHDFFLQNFLVLVEQRCCEHVRTETKYPTGLHLRTIITCICCHLPPCSLFLTSDSWLQRLLYCVCLLWPRRRWQWLRLICNCGVLWIAVIIGMDLLNCIEWTTWTVLKGDTHTRCLRKCAPKSHKERSVFILSLPSCLQIQRALIYLTLNHPLTLADITCSYISYTKSSPHACRYNALLYILH